MRQQHDDYGHFSDDGREYIITRPDPPMPWINVIANPDYGLTLSQAGSGYSWRSHATLNRITRWDQDLVRDNWGKYLYLRDVEDGAFWSAGRQPCGADVDEYRVRHGFGYSAIEARRRDLAWTVTYTVPEAGPCELWWLELHNRGDGPRRLQLFTYFEWLLGAAPDWHREFHHLFIETEYVAAQGALLATKVLWDLPGQPGPHNNRTWPYVAFHSASPQPAGYDSDKAAFLGRLGDLAAPQAVAAGRAANTAGRWGDSIGSLCVEVEAPPGETVSAVFTLGAADDREQALALAAQYGSVQAVHEVLAERRRFWQGIAADLQVETPDLALNRLANGWLSYQAIAGRLWGRTAYYQMGGAYGYRDQLQDSLVWLLLGQPERTLDQIRLHAAHQYQEGIVLHWWHPLAEWGLRSRYSDDLLWLPFVTLHYLDETAGFACLDEELPFFDGGSATLLDHCLRAFDVALARRSPRGLPLILEADWNDGMNAVGDEGRGESIWMAHFLHYLLRRWGEVPALDAETRARFANEATAIAAAANEAGWDGDWYWRATTDEGAVLGSAASEEGKIFLNAQTWAVLSGVADPERAAQVMAAARRHLYTPYGPLLFTPGYTVPNPDIGYLSRYAPGTRENGGVYVHAACWAVLAERRVNGAEAAYQLWRTFCPPTRSAADPDVYAAEPYVMPGNVNGPNAGIPGRAGWTWYTGSGQWYLRVLVEGVLGVMARRDGLYVDPDLPAGWPGFRLSRRFRGARYQIQVRRAGPGEPIGCWVDGKPWDGELLPLAPAGRTVDVVYTVAPAQENR